MGKRFEIPEIRSEDIDVPVQVWLCDNTGRYYLRCINEGGFACVDLDLEDLAKWFGCDPGKIISAVSAGEYPSGHVACV